MVPVTDECNGGVGFRPSWIPGPKWCYRGSVLYCSPTPRVDLSPRPAFVQCPRLPQQKFWLPRPR